MNKLSNNRFSSNWCGKSISELDLDQVSSILVTGHDANSLSFSKHYMDEILKSIEDKTLQNKTCSILDFGCGVGRNLFGVHNYLKENEFRYKDGICDKVNLTGYDSMEMLSHLRSYSSMILGVEFNEFNNISISHSWNEIKSKYYDIIFANLVFQHVEVSTLEEYLEDIKQITNKLVVSGRSVNDFNGNVWRIMLENGYVLNLEDEYILSSQTDDITHHARYVYTWE